MLSKVRIILGILALLVCIAGLVLPILQGWLFLAIGALLLSRDVPAVEKSLNRLEERFPMLRRETNSVKKRFSSGQGWGKRSSRTYF